MALAIKIRDICGSEAKEREIERESYKYTQYITASHPTYYGMSGTLGDTWCGGDIRRTVIERLSERSRLAGRNGISGVMQHYL